MGTFCFFIPLRGLSGGCSTGKSGMSPFPHFESFQPGDIDAPGAAVVLPDEPHDQLAEGLFPGIQNDIAGLPVGEVPSEHLDWGNEVVGPHRTGGAGTADLPVGEIREDDGTTGPEDVPWVGVLPHPVGKDDLFAPAAAAVFLIERTAVHLDGPLDDGREVQREHDEYDDEDRSAAPAARRPPAAQQDRQIRRTHDETGDDEGEHDEEVAARELLGREKAELEQRKKDQVPAAVPGEPRQSHSHHEDHEHVQRQDNVVPQERFGELLGKLTDRRRRVSKQVSV